MCDSHLPRHEQIVLQYMVASTIFFNNSSMKVSIRNYKAKLTSTEQYLSRDTNISSMTCMGAGPISLEWSDVISRGYNWNFPHVCSFLAHISKYKRRAKNYKDVADSSKCEDSNGVKNVKISTFVCRPIREEVKGTSPLLVRRLGRSHEYADAQTSRSYHRYLSGVNAVLLRGWRKWRLWWQYWRRISSVQLPHHKVSWLWRREWNVGYTSTNFCLVSGRI